MLGPCKARDRPLNVVLVSATITKARGGLATTLDNMLTLLVLLSGSHDAKVGSHSRCHGCWVLLGSAGMAATQLQKVTSCPICVVFAAATAQQLLHSTEPVILCIASCLILKIVASSASLAVRLVIS